MSTIINLDAPATPVSDTTVSDTATARSSRRLWAWAGAGAALVGFVASNFLNKTLTEAQATGSAHQVAEALKDAQTIIQLSCGLGLIATVAMLIFTSGLQRRFEEQGVAGTIAARVMDKALTASAGAMFIGFGSRAIIAGSLANGVDRHSYSDEGRAALFAVLDNFPYIAWMGVAMAAGAAAVLALHHRALSKPVGIVGLLVALLVGGMTLGLGLPYSAALAGPIWLAVASVSMTRPPKAVKPA